MLSNVGELHAAPKIFKDTCRIEWNKPSKRIYDFVRGLSPVPGAWTTLVAPDGKSSVLKIFATSKTNETTQAVPGSLSVVHRQLFVATVDGLLRIDELQAAGKKRMPAADFLNGVKDIERYILA